MTTTPSPAFRDIPVCDVETDTCYSTEAIARLAGVNPEKVLRYKEQGFIRPVPSPGNADSYGIECLRQLRRIEHLRVNCEMNDSGLRLILELLHETECLCEERRQMLRYIPGGVIPHGDPIPVEV